MPDAANAARELAELFADTAKAVDAYRSEHLRELTPEQRTDLEQLIQKIDDIHDECTADAIEAALNGIQSDLDRIASVTNQAKRSLQHLKTVEKVTKVASAVAELGAAIMTSDYGAIPSAIQDIAGAVSGDPDASSSGKGADN